MKKKFLLTFLGLLLLVAAIVGIKAWQITDLIAAGKNFKVPPISVQVTEATTENWADHFDAVGTIESVQGVTLANEVAGKVEKIAFESGSMVAAGDVLVILDKASEEAQLRSAMAAAELATLNLNRTRDLRKTSVISQSELDTAESQHKNTAARVEELQWVLQKRTIKAPFSGRVGIRQIQEGQFLQAGAPIVSLQSIDPVYVNFSLPQQRLSDLSVGMKVQASTDALPGRTFDGLLTAIDAEVDALTRNIRLQATIPNKDGGLRPGMFAAVSAIAPEEKTHTIIPGMAVIFAAYGNSVFVLKEETDKDGEPHLVCDQKFVRLGSRKGDFVSVEEGLQAGEKVVSAGAFKLHKGAAVVIAEGERPAPSTTPHPPEK
ncbi:efflux RND transporter periplasmic adaptor subunit [bacterium]|nr:efflux RND transporter periplasmic adaptor subunit [bacterium]